MESRTPTNAHNLQVRGPDPILLHPVVYYEISKRDHVIEEQRKLIMALEVEIKALRAEYESLKINTNSEVPNTKNRHWTVEEHLRFLHGLHVKGRGRIKEMTPIIVTRNSVQVKSHHQKFWKANLDSEKNTHFVRPKDIPDVIKDGETIPAYISETVATKYKEVYPTIRSIFPEWTSEQFVDLLRGLEMFADFQSPHKKTALIQTFVLNTKTLEDIFNVISILYSSAFVNRLPV